MIDKLDLNSKAIELRKRFGIDAYSPIDVFGLASQIEKLTLVLYPMGDNISGICIKDKTELIAINSDTTLGRQRFSLAHEFYHFFYDDNQTRVCSIGFDGKNENEKRADQFATYFMAPDAALKEKIRGRKTIGLNEIIELEQYFGMSHLSMLWRLYTQKSITEEQKAVYSMINVTNQAKLLGYSTALYAVPCEDMQKMTYGHYLKQVNDLFEKEKISQGKRDELLLEAFKSDLVFGGNENGETGKID